MKEINVQELRRNFEELKRQPEHKLYLETNSLYRIKVMLFEQALKPKYYSIAALGQFSSGKSTMINALVGESLLIEKSEESTSVITNLRYGSKKQIILENLDGSNQIVACTHENLQKYTTKAFSESHSVKEATIEVPLAYLQNDVQLIDTPGSNSLNQELFEKTKFIIEQSIAVIMTIPAGKFTQSEQVFVQQIKQAKQHLFVVLTRKSDVNPKEHNDNIKSTEKILNQVLEKKDYTVVLVDSKQALEAKQTKNQELLQKSGYPEFEQKIADYIASGKYVQDYQAIVKQKYDELESIYLEIEENKTRERQKQDEILRIQRGRYKKSLFEEKDNIMNWFLTELQHNLRKTQQENEIYYLKQIESSHKNFKNSSEPEFEKIDKKIKLVGTSSNFKSAVEDVKKQAKNIPRVYQQNLNDLSTTLSEFLIANQNSFKEVIIGDFQQSFEKNLNQQMTMKMTSSRLDELEKQLQAVQRQEVKFRITSDSKILDKYQDQEYLLQQNKREKATILTKLRDFEQDILRLNTEIDNLEAEIESTKINRYRPRPTDYITVTETKPRFLGFGKKEVSTTKENPELARWKMYQTETNNLINQKDEKIYQKEQRINLLRNKCVEFEQEIENLEASDLRLKRTGRTQSRELISNLNNSINKEKEDLFVEFKKQVQINIDLVTSCMKEYYGEMSCEFEKALEKMLDQMINDEMKIYDQKINQIKSEG